MAEFKCISCGAVKESENSCSCPVCGYKMFEVPFERSEVLRKEIRNFISCLKLNEVSFKTLSLSRKVAKKKISEMDEEKFDIVLKSEDDKRFPDFNKIQGYVCSSTKTEIFIERLNQSIDQIRKHIHEPYVQEYEVSLDWLSDKVNALDVVLRNALPELGISLEIPDVVMPEIKLSYSETPNDELLGIANELLDDLTALSAKINKFIKQNNIYGTAYQKKPNKVFKPFEEGDYVSELETCRAQLSKVLKKKYTVDIFSDGSEELNEMLRALWKSIEAIMTFPVLIHKYAYTFSDGTAAVNEEIEKEILDRLAFRYQQLEKQIYACDFLADKSDDELFDIYDKLIALDTYGFMGVNKNGLLKIGESEKKLNELIGLSGIKESIKKIKAYALANKDSDDLNIHMCFLGNPGTGKTEVARYIAGIMYENKILPTNKVVEVDRSGLVSQYFGATAEKTSRVISSAMGGVLFIDEAYALGNNSDHGGLTDYGKEAIDTLVKAMEDYRGKFCVIFAGYKNEMQKMLDINPGLKSRIQFTLDFPNYSRDELRDITNLMLNSRHYTLGDAAMNRILDITDSMSCLNLTNRSAPEETQSSGAFVRLSALFARVSAANPSFSLHVSRRHVSPRGSPCGSNGSFATKR